MPDTDPTGQAVLPPPEIAQSNGDALAPPAESEMPTFELVDVGGDGVVEAEIGVATAIPATDEPSVLGDLGPEEVGALGGPIVPIPLPTIKRRVAGRYRSTGAPFQVELRVDVDGRRPTMRVSADYYSVSGGTVTYFGSMRVDATAITVTPTTITITGTGTYTWAAAAPQVRVTIPRTSILSPPASATLQHLTTGGAPGATYICRYASPSFRSVLFEQDRQDTVAAPFVAYNTGSLPSGGPARTLSVSAAYAEAGIEMQSVGVIGVVPTGAAGANASWSDAELHAAMQSRFSRWQDLPQWAVWLFHAQLHDLGSGLLGIMFDQQGRQRQGCAVFYQGIGGAAADQQRLQLYTCAHELGHCFNLLHSWQKSFATPPAPNRPNSLSWMNYPWRFPGGPAAFWSTFPFEFDSLELIHLRHAFRNNIIMGGNPFATGAALEDPESWRDPIQDDSGLKLELRAPASMPYGAPVSVDLLLSATGAGRLVTPHMRPRNGAVEVAIQKPSGQMLRYRPLLHHCASDADLVRISADSPPQSESAFIHYGQDGFVFDHPGLYRLRARFNAVDGSIVLSNIVSLRVRTPVSSEDEEAADLAFGDEQGTLFYLVGSDYEGLAGGTNALAELIERYPSHELAAYARVVLGTNAAREFKNVSADNSVSVRPAAPKEAAKLLAPVLDVLPVQKAAAKMTGDEAAMLRAAATHLGELGPGKEVPEDVRAYIRARRREIATEVALS